MVKWGERVSILQVVVSGGTQLNIGLLFGTTTQTCWQLTTRTSRRCLHLHGHFLRSIEEEMRV